MNDRIWSDLVSFNCTTALGTGWPDASVTTPFTDRVAMLSSLERRSWPDSPHDRRAVIKQTQEAGLPTDYLDS